MKKAVAGLLAHVDAGKTTLAEAMLFCGGSLKALGRVDYKNSCMDNHELERERGITIFSQSARLRLENTDLYLLDTPGHADFSAEMERTLQVLSYAVLVISATDGVQAHTVTLWQLLKEYHIPIYLFFTKMDITHYSREELLKQVQTRLHPACIDFSPDALQERQEALALCAEELLQAYASGIPITDEQTAALINTRQVFPCLFGSGLKTEGIQELLRVLELYTPEQTYPTDFGARVYKISRDAQGNRLSHCRITGGALRVRDTVCYDGREEKVTQLRVYTGARAEAVEQAEAGELVAVAGLSGTRPGQGLGTEANLHEPLLEPTMTYRLELPPDCTAQQLLPKLQQLEEEDPLLHLMWNERLGELEVQLMGAVQTEVLQAVVQERFGIAVTASRGHVIYRETIENAVEGVGHFEPLRHYAEVHLLLEPLARGSGLVFATDCREDVLSKNWQRLILTHLQEKQHLGVLTGSPITDIKLTLASGRAHLKHTEGGDFRQATYRAVRQGLMQAKSILLEPYYSFRLELPAQQLGRAVSDLRLLGGTVEPAEETGELRVLTGKAPVSGMNDYGAQVAAYTRGQGRLFLQPAGYDVCHNADEILSQSDYIPEADLENTPDSVFCAHGGGFPVKWDRVSEYMHLESCLKKPSGEAPVVNYRNLQLDDKELEAIMEREFGPIRRPSYRASERVQSVVPAPEIRKQVLLVDGYNVIFSSEELRTLAQVDLSAARQQLQDALCNYAAYTKAQLVLVFDAYRVADNPGKTESYHGISVVYTKQNETADRYLEQLTHEIGKNEQVRVVTSDSLIQLSAFRSGVLRMSAAELEGELSSVNGEITRFLAGLNRQRLNNIGEAVKEKNNGEA